MALLNPNMGQTPHSEDNPKAEVRDSGDAKAKKLESLKRFKERKAAKAKESYENSLKLKDELTKLGLMEKLSPAMKDFVVTLCKDPAEKRTSTGVSGSSVFNTLYGDTPKVGDSITLEEIFKRTGKGDATMNILIKRWADKGTIVEGILEAGKKVYEKKFVIKALA